MTEQRISWPHRIVAAIIACVSISVVASLKSLIVTLAISPEFPRDFMLREGLWHLPLQTIYYLVFALVPWIVALWLILRRSFPPLWVALVTGFIVTLLVAVLSQGQLVMLQHPPSSALSFILWQIVKQIPASAIMGAFGGAAAWAYLNWVRKRAAPSPHHGRAH